MLNILKSVKVYANPMVGRTGLSNMLFCWARAEYFCQRFGAKMLAPQWVNVCRIGPVLRMERDKRYYFNMFSNDGCVGGIPRLWLLHTIKHISEKGYSGQDSCIIDFAGMEGFFNPFMDDHIYVRDRLWAITAPEIRRAVEDFCKEPFIGVHIRRADFVLGGLDVPDEWYVSAIENALERVGGVAGRLAIRVFSDAKPDSLAFLKGRFSNLVIMPKAPALHDLWLLSRATVLVGTSRSTFSMWAVFLGQIPSIWHPCETPPLMSADERVAVVLVEHCPKAIGNREFTKGLQ